MGARYSIYADWNPWHGCTKISPGCKYCYVYRQDEMYGSATQSSLCRKTGAFDLPIRKKRDGSYKIDPGKIVFTCFTSDFLLKDADPWREECWRMIKKRSDCYFYFFTKRIDRLAQCLPPDWGGGYENVIIGCTVENQDRADFRLPIFLELPIRHRSIIASPLLEALDLRAYLDPDKIEELSTGGISCPRPRRQILITGFPTIICRKRWPKPCISSRIPQNRPHFWMMKKVLSREDLHKS